MISYLQIEGLTKSYGDRLLFADITMGVYEGDKIGLVARNGTGKSTFLDIIAGRGDYDSGRIVFSNGIRVGYLEQTPHFDPEKSILDNLVATAKPIEGEDIASKATRMLSQFGVADPSQLAAHLSGGQLKRAALARTLLDEPDMLILDEPTNHLDIDMIEWLEDYLTRKRVTLLMVTHDRYFLDRVCNKIIEIDDATIYTYEGNYDYYLSKRTERLENRADELARVRNILRTEQEWMRRQPQARGSKAKYRIDNFHELEQRARQPREQGNIKPGISASYIGSKIFEAHDVCKSFGDKKILDHWNYVFARYEKVGIVGANGVGKTTFLKMLLGEMAPDSGHFDVGQTVKWGYYSQAGMVDFNENAKVIDAVREIAETVRIDEKTTLTTSQFLTRFLFPVKTQQDYIRKLSGGERRRLYLATVLMRSPNFLILDEPTNDLDILTLGVLENYLADFKGCVIIVSHDRFFLDRIADHLFVFEGEGKVRDFPGDYSTYRHCLTQERREASQNAKPSAKTERTRTQKAPKLTFKERQEMQQLEENLEKWAQEKSELEALLQSGTTDHEKLIEASSRIGELMGIIDEAELRLLELMEKE